MDMNQNTQQCNDNVDIGTNSMSYSKVIDAIFDCVNGHLLMLMDQMLSSADEKLIEQADKTSSESERAKFINCTQLFRSEKSDINRLFFMKLNNSLSITPSEIDGESLVDQDEMEEMVAITTMHSKAMNVYGVEVNHLETRLEYLELMCEDIFDKEALDPKHICEVFQRTIENIDLTIEAKLIFYKLFDQEVCSKLGIMYQAINQIFIDNDIMPEIVMRTTKDIEIENIEEEVSSRVATYYDPEEKIHTDFVPRTKAEISRIVNEFMSGDMTISGDEINLPESFLRAPTRHDLDGKDCYERKEVVKALSNLQRKLLSLYSESKPLSTEQIKRELLDDIRHRHNGTTEKKVSLLDERNIDFVGMMFDVITDDKTVSEIMTNMIKRLQIPMMKVAMSDSNLFDNEEHPARTIVHLLTMAGKGINSQRDRLFSSLEAIVDNILNEYDTDLTVFKKAVHVLESISHTEEQLAQRTEKKEQRKIIQIHAKKIVTAQFKLMSRNKKIPDDIRPLILRNWPTLMLNRYLRYGRNSSQWNQSVLLFRLLLKCIQPIRLKNQYTLVNNNHQALAESVNDELYETQQDRSEISSQIDVLKKHFLKTIDNYSCKTIDTASEPGEGDGDSLTVDESDISEFDKIQTQMKSAEEKISKLSSNTRPGAWYEIYTGEGKALRRLKLSIILNDTARLIFVDRKGIKVIEKDAEEFSRELADDRSRLIADHSTFDHALEKIIGAIAA